MIPLLFEMCIQLGRASGDIMGQWQYGAASQDLIEQVIDDKRLVRITLEAVRANRGITITEKERAILEFKDGVQMQCLSGV
tara:strand:- start:2770 stop:3012 length:243 start_codon:yes stop_codon:yes gene_type:complete